MLSKMRISGQASWLSGEAAMNTAKLNLVSAYTSYVWQVAGVETGTSGGTAAAAGSSGGGRLPEDRGVRESLHLLPQFFFHPGELVREFHGGL